MDNSLLRKAFQAPKTPSTILGLKELKLIQSLQANLPPGMSVAMTMTSTGLSIGLVQKAESDRIMSTLQPMTDAEHLQILNDRLGRRAHHSPIIRDLFREFRISEGPMNEPDVRYFHRLYTIIEEMGKPEDGGVLSFYKRIAEEEFHRIRNHLKSGKKDIYIPRYSWFHERLSKKRMQTAVSSTDPSKGWMTLTKKEIDQLVIDGIHVGDWKPYLEYSLRTLGKEEKVFIPPYDISLQEAGMVKTGLMSALARKLWFAFSLFIPFGEKGPAYKIIREIRRHLGRQNFRIPFSIFVKVYLGAVVKALQPNLQRKALVIRDRKIRVMDGLQMVQTRKLPQVPQPVRAPPRGSLKGFMDKAIPEWGKTNIPLFQWLEIFESPKFRDEAYTRILAACEAACLDFG